MSGGRCVRARIGSGVGTAIDPCSKVGFATLDDRRTASTVAERLNHHVIRVFEGHGVRVERVATGRGTEFCVHISCTAPGSISRSRGPNVTRGHIDHTRTKTKSPQTNGICERFHKTLLDEFSRIAFRRKLYHSLEELRADLDAWLREYNEERTHQGRWCYGKTPMQTFLETVRSSRGHSLPLARDNQNLAVAA